MYLEKQKIAELSRLDRIHLINSITGIKPALLVGTINKKNVTNLAIFSSIVHISSDPPLIGFFVRNNKKLRRDTLENISECKSYTLNHIHPKMVKNSHNTSIKFDKDVSEFDLCGFNEDYIENFPAPFVKESNIRMGLSLKEVVSINSSPSKLVIGEITHIFLNEKYLKSNYSIDLQKSDSISVGGLNSYYRNIEFESLPYARLSNFKKCF